MVKYIKELRGTFKQKESNLNEYLEDNIKEIINSYEEEKEKSRDDD